MRLALPNQALTVRSPEAPVAGRYRLEFLAQGGMSCTYRARLGERDLFVKEAPREHAQPLRREAHMLQRLPLGNFPRFVELCEADDFLYLVTEFIQGSTLEQEVENDPWSLPEPAELIELARALCRQVEILHALKPPILYLDCKPANVLRQPGGQLFLVDFGIAQFGGEKVTPGDYLGTPLTASPEHYTGKLDVRSDLFSLAATVYYVATRGQVLRAAGEPFPPLRELHPACAEHLDGWLQKCLALNAEQRYPDVAAARRALEGEQPARARSSWLSSLFKKR